MEEDITGRVHLTQNDSITSSVDQQKGWNRTILDQQDRGMSHLVQIKRYVFGWACEEGIQDRQRELVVTREVTRPNISDEKERTSSGRKSHVRGSLSPVSSMDCNSS